jgi:preprotein translocase SecE subunit
VTAKVKAKKENKIKKFFKSIGNFFVGLSKVKFIGAPLRGLAQFAIYIRDSWRELKLVRWPNRRATWKLVLAVIGFSGFFVLLIVLLDAGFKILFELIIK